MHAHIQIGTDILSHELHGFCHERKFPELEKLLDRTRGPSHFEHFITRSVVFSVIPVVIVTQYGALFLTFPFG
jgi:hypothetical protein